MQSPFLNGGMIGTTLDFGANTRYVVGTTQQRDTIGFVGGRTVTSTSVSSFNVTLNGLTGGLATAPATNDLVLVARAWAGNTDLTMTTSSTGWGELTELYSNSTNDTNFSVFWKFMGATPDTSITFNAHTTGFGESSSMAVYVFRNVDLTTPFDVTSTTASQTTTALVNPTTITPTTANSIIVVAGGNAHSAGTGSFTASYLTNFITVGSGTTTFDSTVGIGYVTWSSGAYDPAAWTFSFGDSTAYSAAALTMALRPRLITVDILGNLKNSGVWNLEAEYDYSYSQYTPPSQVVFTTTGSQSWTVPVGITEISAVVVGGGGGGSGGDGGRGEVMRGGGGGGLAYGTFTVTPGEVLTVVVGTGGTSVSGSSGNAGNASSISRGATVLLSGGGGAAGLERTAGSSAGGTSTGTEREGGGAGGAGGAYSAASGGSGGGGGGGYSAAGGAGGLYNGAGVASTGGGGGGGGGFSGTTASVAGSGGGVGLLGAGSNGTGGTGSTGGGGGGGSGGTAGSTNSTTNTGSLYGGGGGGRADSSGAGAPGGQGAVRIIWGPGRSYPSTNTADVF